MVKVVNEPINNDAVINLFNNETQPTTIPPNMGYFDKNKANKANTANSAYTIKSLLQANCANIETTNLLTPDNPNQYYDDTITGNINPVCDGPSSVEAQSTTIASDVSSACKNNDDQEKIVNTIKYLVCQLAFARNRTYDSSKFDILNGGMTVQDVFDKFSNIKIIMYIVFLLSIYFLIQGFFSSFDVATNMMNLVEENASKTLIYYVSLGFGIAIPVLILCLFFVQNVCGSLSALELYNITNSYDGILEKISSGFQNLDYSVLMIFIFLIYGLTVALFVINKESTGPTLYISIVCCIFVIISVFLYIFYNFIPFFATADINNYGKKDIDLKLYIDDNGRQQPGNITSNQTQVQNLKSVFIKTTVVIFIIFLIYIIFSKKLKDVKGWKKDIFSGFFGASAILIIPIVWVINYIFATSYFYAYPLILLMFRFLRYIGMAILYGQYSYSQEYGIDGLFSGDTFSNELKEQLDDFSTFSPSWNLIGMDIIKTLMNINGYENIFSKKYVNENKANNLASNKYVIAGIFSYLGKDKDDNKNENSTRNKLTIQGIILFITLVISYILVKLVYKIK